MSKNIREKIRKTDSLLIDEISMLDGHLFDTLECMVSIIRCYDDVKDQVEAIKSKNRNTGEEAGGQSEQDIETSIMSQLMLELRWKLPRDDVNGLGDIPAWGGMQLIVVGDFFQLPPVA